MRIYTVDETVDEILTRTAGHSVIKVSRSVVLKQQRRASNVGATRITDATESLGV